MGKEFKYNAMTEYFSSFEVESIGNVCLEAVDNLEMHYFLMIKTLLGESTILEFGPVVIGDDLLPDNTQITFRRMAFKEKSIIKIINEFTRSRNKGKNKIELVKVVDDAYLLSCGIDIFDYMREFSAESNY